MQMAMNPAAMQMPMQMANMGVMAGMPGMPAGIQGVMAMPGTMAMPMQPAAIIGAAAAVPEVKDGDDKKYRKGAGKGAKGSAKTNSKNWVGANGKANGKGKGLWKFVNYQRPKLTDQELEERRQANVEKHEKRIAEEERKVLSENHIEGEVIQRAKWHAWIKPKDVSQLSEEVREKMAEMNSAFRAKVTDGRAFCGGVEGDVLYLAVADISEDKLVLRAGLQVKFKVYVDNKGVGACDVILGEPLPQEETQVTK